MVADQNVESASQTVENLSHDYKGQEHMVAEVDVSSCSSVDNLLNSIQVPGLPYSRALDAYICYLEAHCGTQTHTHAHTHTRAPG